MSFIQGRQVRYELWMGNVEPYMTADFILNAFRQMNENPLNVKVMRDKFTGQPAGYGFVIFKNDEEAVNAMYRLNLQPIPGTNPVVRFKLNPARNTATNSAGRQHSDREFSIWVGELSPDVEDCHLYKVFATKYNTIKMAKVILDSEGYSKGYGFVRFGSPDEMRDSVATMNGFRGLGTRPLKISHAFSRPRKAETTTTGTNVPSTSDTSATASASAYASNQYYGPSTSWQSYPANWQQGYYDPAAGYVLPNAGYVPPNAGYVPTNSGYVPSNSGYLPPYAGYVPPNAGYVPSNAGHFPTDAGHVPTNAGYVPTNAGHVPPNVGYVPPNAYHAPANADHANQHKYGPPPEEEEKEDDLELVEHTVPLDIDKLNMEVIEQDVKLWDAVESAKWDPFDIADYNYYEE